jgi:GNAT superfamily N-acetyltransferase
MPAATVVRDGWRVDPALVAGRLPASPLVRIRPWRAGDERLIARAADQISAASLRSRFLAGVPRLPETYLRRLATLPPDAWGAQVAVRADRCAEQVVGWAEFVRFATPTGGAGPAVSAAAVSTPAVSTPAVSPAAGSLADGAPVNAEADLAILVLDAWQRRGVGRALIGALVRGAVAGGVRALHADLDPANGAARGLLASVLGRDRLTARVVDGLLHYTVRLTDQ